MPILRLTRTRNHRIIPFCHRVNRFFLFELGEIGRRRMQPACLHVNSRQIVCPNHRWYHNGVVQSRLASNFDRTPLRLLLFANVTCLPVVRPVSLSSERCG